MQGIHSKESCKSFQNCRELSPTERIALPIPTCHPSIQCLKIAEGRVTSSARNKECFLDKIIKTGVQYLGILLQKKHLTGTSHSGFCFSTEELYFGTCTAAKRNSVLLINNWESEKTTETTWFWESGQCHGDVYQKGPLMSQKPSICYLLHFRAREDLPARWQVKMKWSKPQERKSMSCEEKMT